MYYPFPEEFNRKTIDDISTLFFSPTEWSAKNLLTENKNSSNILITGNTIFDSLKLILNNTTPSLRIRNLIEKAKSLCKSKTDCKIILLTCHRKENFYQPIYSILIAIQKLLKNYNNSIVIFPFHLNPNVMKSIRNSIPNIIYKDIIKGKKIINSNYLYFNRFLLIPPLNYIDLVHLESKSYFIMTDSGGIQEEAVSIGKPIIILRENTERPEGVKSGFAFLAGISIDKIYHYATSLLMNRRLYESISKYHNIYGNGNSRIIISQKIQDYFQNNLKNSISYNIKDYKNILYKYDNDILKNKNLYFKDDIYDFIIVLTVWKRNNLERQIIQITNQSILKKKTNIIIFQNANHINVNDIVNKWKNSVSFLEKINITFIQAPFETGYFRRFIIPLTSSVSSNSYFFICDDDIIWGNRYFENMKRVVDEGFLCTSNGRIITKDFRTNCGAHIRRKHFSQVCFNEDIEYDFGGHIWAGLISWLRKAWNHIPPSIENCEDFWIRAALNSFYNISTKIPRCPCPDRIPISPDLCSATDKTSKKHQNAKIGNSVIYHKIRKKIIKEITKKFNFQRLILYKPKYVKTLFKKFVFGYGFFNLNDTIWKDVDSWI